MNQFWQKYHRWVIVAVVVVAVVGVAGAVLAMQDKSVPTEVVSAWPEADSEPVRPKPTEPPVWPLTGLPAPDGDTPANTRIVSVKIENSPVSRPQSGIQSADVVYETITEGGITRFNCLFHSQVPEQIGPVRSARLSDIDIVPQYDALFVFSGASRLVNSAVKAAGLQNLSQDAGVSKGYKRVSFRAAPHNLYIDLPTMREVGVERGYPATQDIRALAFEKRAIEATPSITSITIPFSPANTSAWTYDAEKDAYLRVNNGKVHTDQLTGEQIAAKNVVVMWAKMTAAAHRDVTGSQTFDIELVGSGNVSIFRNGQRFDGTWTGTAAAPPVFKAADGTQLRLAPGNTWFQVIPTNINISMQ